MKTFILNLILISSVVLPSLGNAAEDFSYTAQTLHIRTLAASCSACHGTNGNAVKSGAEFDATTLAGLEKPYIEQRLLDFRSGVRPATVMHQHAKGLTLNEISLLAGYFSHQKVVKQTMPPSQVLKAVNDE